MRQDKGFTLLEVILSMILLGITVAVTVVLMGRGIDSYNLVATRTDSTEAARFALVRMEKEITKATEIRYSQPGRFGFQSPFSLNDTTFFLDGTTLYRDQDPLARNVSSLLFTYYRDNGTTTNAPSQVRRIHIDLSVASDVGSNVALRTDIFPRIFIYENFQ